jgi:hypothetical protein
VVVVLGLESLFCTYIVGVAFQMEGQLAPLQPPSAQAFEASELERKSKERDRAKRGRDAKKEKDAAALEEVDGLRMDNACLRKLRPPSLS